MTFGNFVWWGGFFVAAIWMQRLLPGIDALVVGLLIALQERRPLQIFWITVLLIVLQEGMGTLEFGASLLWYPLVISLFFAGRWLFETRNVLFVFLLSACLGAAHLGVMLLMARLQYIAVDMQALLDESILQALFIPVAWKAAALTRLSLVSNEDSARP